MQLNYASFKIISAAIQVHKSLGPGLLESVYKNCKDLELREMGMKVQTEIPFPIFYHGQKVHEAGFRLDLLVEDKVIVELKSVVEIQAVHKKQVLTYLKLANKPLGLLINFNVDLLKKGITRIINNVEEKA
jgi:GxxExxY protein